MSVRATNAENCMVEEHWVQIRRSIGVVAYHLVVRGKLGCYPTRAQSCTVLSRNPTYQVKMGKHAIWSWRLTDTLRCFVERMHYYLASWRGSTCHSSCNRKMNEWTGKCEFSSADLGRLDRGMEWVMPRWLVHSNLKTFACWQSMHFHTSEDWKQIRTMPKQHHSSCRTK